MTSKAPRRTAPDYAHWMQMATWTHEEAIALSIGCDPDAADEPAKDKSFSKRRQILGRAFKPGKFPNPICVDPQDFLSWMQSNNLDLPEGLIAAAKTRGFTITNWQSEYEALKAEYDALEAQSESTTSPKRPEPTRNSLYKIILGIAIEHHGYNPNAKRNAATAEIVSNVQRAGLSISDDAVLNVLREAAEALDFETPTG
ncbi:MAG: hypothetical protein ACE5FO_14050 [Parvularculaceae bacterium]